MIFQTLVTRTHKCVNKTELNWCLFVLSVCVCKACIIMRLDYLLYKRNYIALQNHRVEYIITGLAIEIKGKRKQKYIFTQTLTYTHSQTRSGTLINMNIETKHKCVRTKSPLILISKCLFINVISYSCIKEIVDYLAFLWYKRKFI